MDDFLPLLLVTAALAAVMGLFAWLASVVRRRGVAGAAITAALASHDEAFRVTAHEAHYEIQAQADRKTPIESPDNYRGSPGNDRVGRPATGERRPLQGRPRRRRRGPGRWIDRLKPGR
ncbi:hypothetical protein LRD69_08375 [Streptomyces sp. JH14]|uniref:hypothetical protein n=1 Tax=Streptomyces sp. JH14 TaxID=2793630 RepID=UPI0023F8AD2B|nr:hypothetical protein [Streptomyces sp. JH14]MDF6042179.1 hypothetical protein [Streptomyces sp. JH14]